MADLAILIPAAGASTRTRGADKLMERVGDTSALRHAATLASQLSPHVFVTLPVGGPFAAPRRAELHGLAATALPIPDAHEGMAASLRAGARAAGTAEGLMILLPDMPGIGADDLRRLAAAFREDPARPLRATAEDGRPGHPVILPRRLLGEVAVLAGDEGARRVLTGETVRLIALPGDRALRDLDTPEDWAAWRAKG
jgi:CTP:molybdopterin cytidylyltransferase MocA